MRLGFESGSRVKKGTSPVEVCSPPLALPEQNGPLAAAALGGSLGAGSTCPNSFTFSIFEFSSVYHIVQMFFVLSSEFK